MWKTIALMWIAGNISSFGVKNSLIKGEEGYRKKIKFLHAEVSII